MHKSELSIRASLANLIYPEGKAERTKDRETHEANQELARLSFHKLWSNAVGTPAYAKADWTDFYALLQSLDALR